MDHAETSTAEVKSLCWNSWRQFKVGFGPFCAEPRGQAQNLNEEGPLDVFTEEIVGIKPFWGRGFLMDWVR
jgi:hypothetical protein